MAYEITDSPLRGVEAKQGTSGHYGIFDQGAQVWSWQPAGAEPVIWMSEKSWFAEGQPLRGGVPICFPWFGPGRNGDLYPMHGFARLQNWHMSDVKDTLDRDGRFIVEYTLNESMTGDQAQWPHPYRAVFQAKFTPEYLGLELRVENVGSEEITFDEALHTYLHVGDVAQVTIRGLDQETYVDKVAGTEGEVQSGDLTITGETDRVYASTAEVVVHDPVLGRDLVISKSGSANTVVWNPWIDKAAAMSDFGDDEWHQMLCIEAANALDAPVVLRPGEIHCLKQRITLA